ncbi:MAG TPA: flagellin [Sphingomonas sp.]|nr:flagellin [Sphingomonas sp.]
MTRVATIPMHRTLFDAIQRSQQKLADAQVQLATGKKAQTYADLGTEVVRTLSARTLVARQEAYGTVAKRLGTTLSIQDANISGIESATESLRGQMLEAIGTGQSAGLQEAIETAFQQFRSALNADEGGVPLFAGSQTDQLPFKPQTLADAAGLPTADAFANDGVRASARVADGLNVQFGVGASDLGSKIFDSFRTLAEAGTIGDVPTPAQMAALSTAVQQMANGLVDVRSINADNGRKQAQVETLATRADDRSVLLQDVISKNEDADLVQLASDLTQRRTALEASYSVFSQLSGLSLVNYLR